MRSTAVPATHAGSAPAQAPSAANTPDSPAPFEPAFARLHQTMAPWVASTPDRIAIMDAHRALRYAELDVAVRETATTLSDLGVRGGDRVVLVTENSVGCAVLLLALSAIDAWSVPVNARLSQREIANIVDHAGARATLYLDNDFPEAREHGLARGAQWTEWPHVGKLMVSAIDDGVEPEPVEADPRQQVAAMIYTTGTTGASKAVMLTHANLMFIGHSNRMQSRVKPGDRIYGVLPISHVYGLSVLLVGPVSNGATVFYEPRFRPDKLVRTLIDDQLTVLHGVPAMYAKIIEWGRANNQSLRTPSLRIAQSGGAPLTATLKAAFEDAFGIVLNNGYGMTETSPTVCQTRVEHPRSDCSVGPAVPDVEIRLGNPLPDGSGELLVRGPNVMKGYYRRPDLTAQTIDSDGWLHTGDLARIDADGAVSIVGRSKEIIIHSGFNVYPEEVEQSLNAFPAVLQSAVVGRAVEGNEEVIAFVEVRSGMALDEAALRAFLRERLSPYKIPAEIRMVQQLPAAPSGKILKARLREQLAAGNV
ncbi:Acyl-CoA synthetase (AMP-forming)/AMP-acid ligase II [Ralstonia sp. 25mfcol4.1]|uniref:class I adenylate-forming enzyme family protein n=1 Tax=Burkholderiaceae TaxID=119060 RepID=UPI00088C8C69|nr:AMP-binding protein [Ralstonia sp. 25mfcol4.1]SDP51666.1 Acyl-CoA synthetase (AMP-forming)/AMP-acid ligase II [Ralstonia sp. 25mfcol4.1]